MNHQQLIIQPQQLRTQQNFVHNVWAIWYLYCQHDGTSHDSYIGINGHLICRNKPIFTLQIKLKFFNLPHRCSINWQFSLLYRFISYWYSILLCYIMDSDINLLCIMCKIHWYPTVANQLLLYYFGNCRLVLTNNQCWYDQEWLQCHHDR